MHCPTCGRNIDHVDRGCPHCGEREGKRLAGMLKTSTILISADNTDRAYRSVREVPEPLRKKLLRSTNSVLSRTILIADRRGRREIEQALQNLPGASEQRTGKSALSRILPAARRRLTVTQTIGILLTGAAGLLLVWLMLSQH